MDILLVTFRSTYRSRTHLWQRDPPYVLDTVFSRFDILLRSSGRDGVI